MILITGSRGQLGQELIRLCNLQGIAHVAYDLPEWDITDSKVGREILEKHRPAVLANAAAYTAVDKAESEEDLARKINGAAPGLLKDLAGESGAFFVQISTDFVFSSCSGDRTQSLIRPWTTEDPVSPLGVYAITKEEGERSVFESNRRKGLPRESGLALIRTSWVYSNFGKNFPLTMLKLASDPDRKELTVIEDQIGRPTWARSLAIFILKLLESQGILSSGVEDRSRLPGGIYHFSNSGVASWYDFARATIELGHRHGILDRRIPVRPIPTEAYPTPAPRPGFTVLNLEKSREIWPDIPDWREDLEEFLLEYRERNE